MSIVSLLRERVWVGHIARLAIVVWGVLAMVGSVGAGETIETDSFALALPDRWIPDLRTKPISAKGPAGELLQVSSSSLSGQGSAEEGARIMRQVEEKAIKSMRLAEADPALLTVAALKRTTLPSGVTLHEMLPKSRDGKSLFAQFAVSGPRSLVLVTLELPASAAASVDAVRKGVVGIRWTK